METVKQIRQKLMEMVKGDSSNLMEMVKEIHQKQMEMVKGDSSKTNGNGKEDPSATNENG